MKEAQFLVPMEDDIRQPGLSKSVQRYQLVVDEAKVRLNFVTCPGAWLMPSRMVINSVSTVGYNNQLKQETTGMKRGVNNDVHITTKKLALNTWTTSCQNNLAYQPPLQSNPQCNHCSTVGQKKCQTLRVRCSDLYRASCPQRTTGTKFGSFVGLCLATFAVGRAW